ncbi:MAG: hypothetical protein U7127_05125 [Phormidium sp.]
MIYKQTIDHYTEYETEPEIDEVEPQYPKYINDIIDKPFTLVTSEEWQQLQQFFSKSTDEF